MWHDDFIPVKNTDGHLLRGRDGHPRLGHHSRVMQPWLESAPNLEDQFDVPEASAHGPDTGQNGGLPRVAPRVALVAETT